jgi:preprotein translocase subunit SecF
MVLRFIPDKTQYRFVAKRRICIFLSLLVILGTAFSLATKGLNFGIDFSGGILMEIKTEQPADLAEMRAKLGKGVSLQTLGSSNAILIRVAPEKNTNQVEQAKQVKERISEVTGGKVEFRKVDYVGAQVGGELIKNALTALIIKNALTALILSFAAMFAYMWFRFEWQYGTGALLALVHDATAVLGFYSVTGIEFDLTSVAAILTVIGYSINDSVVIYDRLRENIRKYKKMTLADLIDLSVNETLSRTIMTAGTMILALISLSIFGGDVLRSFSLGMLFGVFVGTYSSIYVSAILLIYLDPRKTEFNKQQELAKGI